MVDTRSVVAIIRCSQDEAEYIRWGEQLRTGRQEEMRWKTTRPKKDWRNGAHLTLLVTSSPGGDVISGLGWTTRVRESDDLGEKLEVSRIELLTAPVSLSDVTGRLASRHLTHYIAEGQQSEQTGKALVNALQQARPDLASVIDQIQGVADRYPIHDSLAGQLVALQRDATIAVGRMAGMDISDFARWDRPPRRLDDAAVPPPFTQMASSPALEDRLIDHDAQTMLGWLTEKTQHVSWRVLTGFGQRLLVANANREAAETTLGVDVIYYNSTRESLVLVQYKKLDAARNGFYYPDSDQTLGRELIRMRAVDRLASRTRLPGDDYRLMPNPSWIKLCHPQAFIPQTADMIPGIYLSREHFEQLRNDPRLRGPRGGTRFGYATVPSYLDNTMFTRLVETGFIGTSGTSTDAVHQQIIRSFNGRKAVVLATLHGEELPQSKRTSQRRHGK